MSPLISPEELLDLLVDAHGRLVGGPVGDQGRGSPPVTLLDVRWQLGREDGHQQYLEGHVPGAVYVDLPRVLAEPAADRAGRAGRGRHPLPVPAVFTEAMRRVGVSTRRPVVVYDDAAGTAAARAWWLLRHYGHPDVRVLDGGWSAWLATGGPSEPGEVQAAYGDFDGRPGHLPTVDAAGAAAVAREGVLVDARAPERYRGENEPVDPVAGHVPGAVNVPTDENLQRSGSCAGRFKSPAELAEVYAEVHGRSQEVAVYCGSGVTAAHDVLALELLGVQAALYPGSWSEWITDPGRPVATGEGDRRA